MMLGTWRKCLTLSAIRKLSGTMTMGVGREEIGRENSIDNLAPVRGVLTKYLTPLISPRACD